VLDSYQPLPDSDCPRCRRYGPLNHDRHERFGKGTGMGRKRCEVCGQAIPNRARTPYCEAHLKMVRREKNAERAKRLRDERSRQRAYDILSAPFRSKAGR
jgi:hypothetical protein